MSSGILSAVVHQESRHGSSLGFLTPPSLHWGPEHKLALKLDRPIDYKYCRWLASRSAFRFFAPESSPTLLLYRMETERSSPYTSREMRNNSEQLSSSIDSSRSFNGASNDVVSFNTSATVVACDAEKVPVTPEWWMSKYLPVSLLSSDHTFQTLTGNVPCRVIQLHECSGSITRTHITGRITYLLV